MRILIVTDVAWPAPGELGRHAEVLAAALRRRGHQASVATPTTGRRGAQVDPHGTVVHEVPASHRHRRRAIDPGRVSPVADPGVVAGLVRLIEAVGPDVVHAHGGVAVSCLHRDVRRLVPVAVTLHDHLGPAEGVAANVALRVGRRSLRQAGAVLTVSPGLVDQARGVGVRHVAHVPGFVGPTGTAAGPRPSWVPDGPYALCVGASGPSQGLDVVRRAWATGDVGLPIVVVGAPTSTDDVPGVLARPSVPRDEVMRAWHHAEIGVVPTLCPEPWPTTVLEAMASGSALVASAAGGIPDQVGDTAVLVRPGDARALGRAVAHLHRDAAGRSALAIAARARVTAFEIETVVPRLENVYRMLAA